MHTTIPPNRRMKKMSEIEKNMKEIIKIAADSPNEDLFSENIEGEKGAPDIENPEFRVKAATLQANGSLHIQLGHPEPEKVWDWMEKTLGTPFAQTNSDRVLRAYGAAFNIVSANGSIDQHEMQELGHRLMESEMTTSFASAAKDYVTMEFVKVVDGKDNRESDVKMLEFKVGSSEEQLFVAFSHLDVLRKTGNENYPCVRQECLLGLLVDEFTGVDTDA